MWDDADVHEILYVLGDDGADFDIPCVGGVLDVDGDFGDRGGDHAGDDMVVFHAAPVSDVLDDFVLDYNDGVRCVLDNGFASVFECGNHDVFDVYAHHMQVVLALGDVVRHVPRDGDVYDYHDVFYANNLDYDDVLVDQRVVRHGICYSAPCDDVLPRVFGVDLEW